VEELESECSNVCSVNNVNCCSFSFQEQRDKPKTLVCAALLSLHIITIHFLFSVLLLHYLFSLSFREFFVLYVLLYISYFILIRVIQTNHSIISTHILLYYERTMKIDNYRCFMYKILYLEINVA
jgi:hypothetical protein